MSEVGQPSTLVLNPSLARTFSPQNRHVSRLYMSPESEVLVVCWEPGQQSSSHSHGNSESIVLVLEGRLIVIAEGRERVVEKHEITITPRGTTHQLINKDKCRAVTLHIYAPSTNAHISHPFRDLSSDLMKAR